MPPKNAKSQIKYPIVSHSWRIISSDVCIKSIDKTVIYHSNSVIPIEIREYFCALGMEHKDKKRINLLYNDKLFDARIEMCIYSNKSKGKSTIRWKSDLADIIHKKFGDYVDNLADVEMAPEFRFVKINDGNYHIELIDPFEIYEDASNEFEGYSGSKEGRRMPYSGKRYERDPKNRRVAIEVHGFKCKICNFDFQQCYGEHGSGFIEIHHLYPLYTGDEKNVNPRTELIPVCSNCHRMIHRRRENYLTPEMLKEMISTARKYNSTE